MVNKYFSPLQLNPDVNAFQCKFVNEVRRCEEMERKLSKYEVTFLYLVMIPNRNQAGRISLVCNVHLRFVHFSVSLIKTRLKLLYDTMALIYCKPGMIWWITSKMFFFLVWSLELLQMDSILWTFMKISVMHLIISKWCFVCLEALHVWIIYS